MRISRTVPQVLVAGATVVAAAMVGTPAQASAPSDGCPTGYDLMSVSALSAQGYRVPAQVDDPASGILSFGRAGNGDGSVCAVALGNQTTSFGGQVYNFWDNTLLSG